MDALNRLWCDEARNAQGIGSKNGFLGLLGAEDGVHGGRTGVPYKVHIYTFKAATQLQDRSMQHGPHRWAYRGSGVDAGRGQTSLDRQTLSITKFGKAADTPCPESF